MTVDSSIDANSLVLKSVDTLSRLPDAQQKRAIHTLNARQVTLLLPACTNVPMLKKLLQARAWELYADGKITHKQYREIGSTAIKPNVQIAQTVFNRIKKHEKQESVVKQIAASSPSFINKIWHEIDHIVVAFKNLFEADTAAFYKNIPALQAKLESPHHVSKAQTIEIVDELAEETDKKVAGGMLFASSFFAMTIGELVKKNGGEEKFYLGSGGDGCFADEVERQVLDEINADKRFLTAQERENFKIYYDATKKPEKINKALDAYWTRVEDLQLEKLQPEELNQKLDKLAHIPIALSSMIFDLVEELPEGEALSLNIGHYNHGMQVSIRKEGGEIQIALFDSGSGLEISFLMEGVLSKTQLPTFYRGGFPAHCGLSVTVSEERFKEVGKQYLKDLIERSCINYDEKRLHQPLVKAIEKAEKELQALPKYNVIARGFLNFKIKWLTVKEALLWIAKWKRTLIIFGSIAPNSTKLIPELLGSQWIGNCTAKRLKAIQRKEMGYSLYQKMNARQHEYSKRILLDSCMEKGYIDEAMYQALKAMKPELSAPTLLAEASRFLSRFDKFPPRQNESLSRTEIDENNQAVRYVVLLMNHNLFHLNIPNRVVRDKDTSLPNATKQELSTASLTIDDLQTATLVKRFRDDRSIERVLELNIHGQRRNVSKETYFRLVLKERNNLLDHDICTNLLFLAKDDKMTLVEQRLLRRIFFLQAQAMIEERTKILDRAKKMLEEKMVQKPERDLLRRSDQELQTDQLKALHKEIEQFTTALAQITVKPQVNRHTILPIRNSFFKAQELGEQWEQRLLKVCATV